MERERIRAVAGNDNVLSNFTEKRQANNSLLYDGKKLYVINNNQRVIYSTPAFSGKGKYMNKPEYQNKQDLGPIPEGEYSFSGKDWNALSPLQQLWRFARGGDWGAFNVKLNPVNYKGSRFGFYLHGGSYPGSAGCIDVLQNIKYIRKLTYHQGIVRVVVKYK